MLLDGGIRRGGDVAKALALGAKAVMIGRAYLWGLGANGEAGVGNVLDLLRDGLGSAMIGLGNADRRPTSAATTWSSRRASSASWATTAVANATLSTSPAAARTGEA